MALMKKLVLGLMVIGLLFGNGVVNAGPTDFDISTPYFKSIRTVNQNTVATVTAYQLASVLKDGSAFTGTNYTMATTWVATKFVLTSSATVGNILAKIKVDVLLTNPTAFFVPYIYTDDGGSPSKPGTLVSEGAHILYGQLTLAYYTWSTSSEATLAPGTYWLVFRRNSVPTGGNIIFDSSVASNMGATSSNGTTWTNTNVQLYYQILGLTGATGDFFSQNSFGVMGGSSNLAGVWGYSENFSGVYGQSSNQYGGYFLSPDSVGCAGYSTNWVGVEGQSINSHGGYFQANPASTNTIVGAVRAERTSSGTAAAGIGGSYDMYLQNAAGEVGAASKIVTWLSNAGAGTETSSMGFYLRTAGGAATQVATLDGAGLFTATTLAGKISTPTTNGSAGTVTLTAGATTTVLNTRVTAASLVFLQPTNLTATSVTLLTYVSVVSAGVSFTITTVNAAGTETFNYWIVN